jgi:hypothetical protein
MSGQHEFYLERAAEARAAAEATNLENVRQRHLRAEAAWIDMANRVADTEQRKAANTGH